MISSEAGTTSDAAPESRGEYQVFLNFRGPDTRHGFTDFLYHSLGDAGVHVFRDEDELRVGEVIEGNLLCAINNSMIYIPIFSRTYASSKWCLRELAHIADNASKSKGKKSIFPIFFHVEPEDVKLRTPLYSDALLEHVIKFPDEVEVWRRALAEVDEIKGWIVKEDRSQAAIIKLVVKKVLEKLELKQKSVTEHLVGLDNRVQHLTELLDVNHRDVRLIGIYGMGGMGKTTVAKVVFNELSFHFGKCCSFLENVRENMTTEGGTVQLQKKLLSDIVNSQSAEMVNDSEQGMRRIGDKLGTKKALVVLDDVDSKEHIKKLIGNKSLHSGSRIIITTRNTTIMQVQGFRGKIIPYEMLKMADAFALQLFCRHAFGRDFPSNGYYWISREIISSTGGLPLAIKVIGSLLNRKDEAFWEETLIRLRNVPEEEIQKKLRISYDDLDEYQQQIFLDIACFLRNEKKTDAIYMWASCQFYPKRGIDVLTSRCLIKILDDDEFWMHDQLIDMGRQIVRQQSPSDVGKRSRLWTAEEAFEIIRTKTRKDEVQALEINGRKDFTEITNEELERLPNLRFLNLGKGTFAGDFAKCKTKLRWISWHSPHGDYRANNMYLDHLGHSPLVGFRADNMYLDHLVVFKIYGNDFTDDSKAWDLIKGARNLKVLYLTKCRGITTIPDLSKCLGLERLTLAHCRRLKRIESFIGDLQSLIELEIVDCIGLADLPEEVGALVKLKRFSLQGCSSLRELPGSLGNLTSLIKLDFVDTRIRELPNSIGKLKSLRVLCFAIFGHRENHVWQLPSSISNLVNLEELDLSRHNVTGEIPVGIGELSSLRLLNLNSTGICGIPWTINRLCHLQTLNLRECHSIQVLPELPTSLTCLLLESMSLLSVPNLWNLTNLVELQLHDGSWGTEKSNLLTGCNLSWIGRLYRLKILRLNLLNVPAPRELASLSHLERLTLYSLDLETLGQLPSTLLRLDLRDSSIKWAELLPLRNLSTLEVYGCEVEDIPFEGLPRLDNLTVDGCKQLQRLSIPSRLWKLRQVDVKYCPELVEIQVVGLSKSLENLSVGQCQSLTRLSGLSYLKNLVTLKIEDCHVLTNVEGLDELESLKSLEVKRCVSLRWLIDASCTEIPDDCLVEIRECGDSIKDAFENCEGIPKCYRETILQAPGGDWVLLEEIKTDEQVNGMMPLASKRGFFQLYVDGWFDSEPSKAPNIVEDQRDLSSMERLFAIIFHLGVKKPSGKLEFVGGIKRENENITPDSVTYKGLIADVKGFGFHLKRMWYETPGVYCDLLIEIKSDEQVKGMVQLASKRRSIHLYVEGGIDSEWEGEYDDKMMEMLREEWAMTTDVDGAEWDVSSPDEDSNSASVGESETDGNSSIDDFQSTPGNAEYFEATGNTRQMRDGRNGHSGNVNGGKMTSMENRKKEKDESSCKATTEVEDEGDLSSVKRDRTVQTDRIPTKTGRGSGTRRASNTGRDPAERGRGMGIALSKRNSEGSRSSRYPASTSGKGKASNSGRSIFSISQSNATMSSGRDTILSLGRGRGSSWGRGTTNMSASSSSGRGIASSSRSSYTLSTGRGKGSTSKNDATLSLERGTTKMGLSLRSGADKGSSTRSRATLSIGRGRGLTSGMDATVGLERGTTLSLGRGTTEMKASLRSGTDKGSSS